jgi:hypothetical protein
MQMARGALWQMCFHNSPLAFNHLVPSARPDITTVIHQQGAQRIKAFRLSTGWLLSARTADEICKEPDSKARTQLH